MPWVDYHRDAGEAEGATERAAASAMQRVIMERWRRDFRDQRPELRRGRQPEQRRTATPPGAF